MGLTSDAAVSTLLRADPQFRALVDMLYGPGADADAIVDDVFGKNGPDGADLHIPGAPSPRRSLAHRFAVASTIAGAGLAAAKAGEGATGARLARSGMKLVKQPLLDAAGNPISRADRGKRLGIGLLAGAGDILATDQLERSPRRQPVAKLSLSRLVRGSLTQHRRLVRVTLDSVKPVETPGKRLADRGAAPKMPVAKGVDAEWRGTFTKVQPEKQIALGWASVCKVNGVPVVDRQGDVVDAEDLEDVVYDYVRRSRVGGDMHERSYGKSNGRGLWFGLYDPVLDAPRQVADLVESVVVTKAKKAAMGLPDDYPEGWWVGFRYHDPETWSLIKSGERTGFSIHGTGLRAAVDLDSLMGAT